MSEPYSYPQRPATPQVLLHRLPDQPIASDTTLKPSKYIILIMGSMGTAGKLQIAKSVANAFSCPEYQGESLHQSSDKAASVGRTATRLDESEMSTGPNQARYQRMWLSKLTRTGLLFPEESRPATEGFSGFGGGASNTTSRRGSASSTTSLSSQAGSSASEASNHGESIDAPHPVRPVTTTFPKGAPTPGVGVAFTLSEAQRRRQSNPVLMVLTHPELESWHKVTIRKAVGDYGIGVIFVPLYDEFEQQDEDEDEDEDEDLPILRPFDPTTMTSFSTSFGSLSMKPKGWGNLETEMKLRIDIGANVEDQAAEIIDGVKDVIGL